MTFHFTIPDFTCGVLTGVTIGYFGYGLFFELIPWLRGRRRRRRGAELGQHLDVRS